MKSMQDWLAPLDTLPLECDGMARVISAMLEREGIAHQAQIGRLNVPGVGDIGMHVWIDLDGDPMERIDLRARMWLGDDPRVPHGVFEPSAAAVYEGQPFNAHLDPVVFEILCGKPLGDFPMRATSTSKSTRPR